MSVLEKLKDLVAAMESSPEKKEETPTQPPTQQKGPLLEKEEDVGVEELPDYLECRDSDSRRVYEKLTALQDIKQSIADLLILYERRRQKLFNKVEESTKELYEELNSVRLEYGIPEDGYTVRLPTSPGDKVSFKKD